MKEHGEGMVEEAMRLWHSLSTEQGTGEDDEEVGGDRIAIKIS